MGEIKSALEIALEKTAHIEGDLSSIQKREYRNDGKRLANHYLETGDTKELVKTFKQTPEDRRDSVREGVVSMLLAAVKLPVEQKDTEKISKIGNGLEALVPGQGIATMFGQVDQIFKQYLSEWEQTKKALEQQFMPKLREKQQEMARRYGQAVPMELNQDPEYTSAYSRTKRALDEKYEMVVNEVRARVQEIIGIEEH